MKTYRYKTCHKLILGDLHTPVSTYLKVRDFFSQSALMESSDYHGGEIPARSSVYTRLPVSESIMGKQYSDTPTTIQSSTQLTTLTDARTSSTNLSGLSM